MSKDGENDLRARVDRLEHQNRRLRGMVALLSVPVMAVMLMAARGWQQPDEGARIAPSPEVQAQRFVLVDSRGREQAVLGVGSSGAFLRFLSGPGASSAVGVSLDARGLTIHDGGTNGDGTNGSALTGEGLTIAAAGGRATLEGSALTLRASQTGAEANLALHAEGPRLMVKDASGALAAVGVQNLATRPGLPGKPTSAATITLVGANHRVLWRAPASMP